MSNRANILSGNQVSRAGRSGGRELSCCNGMCVLKNRDLSEEICHRVIVITRCWPKTNHNYFNGVRSQRQHDLDVHKYTLIHALSNY